MEKKSSEMIYDAMIGEDEEGETLETLTSKKTDGMGSYRELCK